MPGQPKIVSMPLSFSASMTSWKPSVSLRLGPGAPEPMRGGGGLAAFATA
jgi:hypothetical protein